MPYTFYKIKPLAAANLGDNMQLLKFEVASKCVADKYQINWANKKCIINEYNSICCFAWYIFIWDTSRLFNLESNEVKIIFCHLKNKNLSNISELSNA